jgi:TRAP transporter 4TM/12TM fusion protein
MTQDALHRSSPAIAATISSGRVLAAVFSLLIMTIIAFFVVDEVNARFGVMAISVFIVTLAEPAARGRMGRWGWLFDAAILAAFVFSGYWFFTVKAELYTGFYFASPINVTAGILGMIALLLLCMRAWGYSLGVMVGAFIVFGFSGPYLPGILEHFGMGYEEFLQIAWYSFDGAFGRITGLVADTVLIFLIFGAVLEATGAGEALIKIATSLTGRLRGGSAHAAIVASAVFGMMSGSVAANIAGTGVFTIPMIKKQGFSANFAGAVETAASSGGQLTPPIMAAAVFVLADFVGIPVQLAILAATLPALFKYIGLFAQVYTEAIRLDIKPLPKDQIPVLTRQDWMEGLMVFVPLASLIAIFVMGKSPATAGLVATLIAIAMGLLINPNLRRHPAWLFNALAEGGLSAAKIILSVGVLGIALAILNQTGIAVRFGTAIAVLGEGNLIIALMLAMFGSLILGMGLPTMPAYLIIAVMIAPAIVQAGVPVLAAHMFVLYFAVYSSIVPPMAYGCYIAAPIAGGTPIATSFVALRISIIGLLVPYVFVFSPSLLLVGDSFNMVELVSTMVRLLAAVWMLATALGGADPRLGRIGPAHRGVRLVVGACAMMPIASFWMPAVLATIAIGLFTPKSMNAPASPA